MRECIAPTLILFCLPLSAQVAPSGWQIIKDSKNACQIAVPADWSVYSVSHSAAFFHDPSTALAVVTSQPGQAFAPLTPFLQNVLNVSKTTLFENSAKRIFYQDKTPATANDPKGYTVSVPSPGGTCSDHLTFLPGVSDDLAKKIALTLGPASEKDGAN